MHTFCWECRIALSTLVEKKDPESLKGPLAQLVEQLTLNQLVRGSSPRRPTKYRVKQGGSSESPFFILTA